MPHNNQNYVIVKMIFNALKRYRKYFHMTLIPKIIAKKKNNKKKSIKRYNLSLCDLMTYTTCSSHTPRLFPFFSPIYTFAHRYILFHNEIIIITLKIRQNVAQYLN